jgi:hypothetical protein
MTKKWIAINFLLLVFTGLLGWQLHNSVLQFYRENDLSRIQPVRDIKQTMPQEQVLLKAVPKKDYNPADFAVISDKNLFSDLRAQEEKTPENVAPPEPPPLAQKPILVGITISGDQQLASIIDPTVPAQNRRAQIKRIGDSYSGYIITEINMDRIVLQSGTRREIIPLHEGTKRGPGARTPVQTTRIISFGGKATGGTATTVASGAAGGGGSTPSRPGPSVASVTPASGPVPQARPAAGPTQSPASPASPAQQQGSAGRVVKTPFGDVVVN